MWKYATDVISFLFFSRGKLRRRFSENNVKTSGYSEASFMSCQHLEKHLYGGSKRAGFFHMQMKCGCIAGALARDDSAHIHGPSRLLRLIQTQTIFPSFAPVGLGFPPCFRRAFKAVADVGVNVRKVGKVHVCVRVDYHSAAPFHNQHFQEYQELNIKKKQKKTKSSWYLWSVFPTCGGRARWSDTQASDDLFLSFFREAQERLGLVLLCSLSQEKFTQMPIQTGESSNVTPNHDRSCHCHFWSCAFKKRGKKLLKVVFLQEVKAFKLSCCVFYLFCLSTDNITLFWKTSTAGRLTFVKFLFQEFALEFCDSMVLWPCCPLNTHLGINMGTHTHTAETHTFATTGSKHY